MSAQAMILDFINYALILLLTVFLIIFFVAGDRLTVFSDIFRQLLPLAVFGLVFLIKIKLSRLELNQKKRDGNSDLTLYLNIFDKILTQIVVYLLPIVIVLIPFILDKPFDLATLIQACAVFSIMYLWQKYLFRKTK
jgi:hypothetical protein